ncbi:zinc metalloproteinase nas-13 [Hydra vulgaris]|uniref:zinc metalloproteinase nas-13 n=1 Tax=Hydra vulgaris TaxID=6087 RepID=UPI001F5F46CD|nr:zinc metalloproteinase nas-13 [Hydra vulgaris]
MLSLASIGLLCFISYTSSHWVPEMENIKHFEGDMVLDPDQRKAVLNGYGSIIGGRWPNNIVPYEMSRINKQGQVMINQAIEQYHKHTCLKFVPRTNQREFLSFYHGDGCSSPVGYQQFRMNEISLASGCFQLGTVMHEIGHSLGFYHEQSRPDRDKYVTIVWKNIQRINGQDMSYNFNMHTLNTINSMGEPYDYESMMHYDSTAFGGGRVTILTTDKNKQNVIGQRNGFSKGDIAQLNKMYPCPGSVTPKPTQLPRCSPGQDINADCPLWAKSGYCTSANFWQSMNQLCCKSCASLSTAKPAATSALPQCTEGVDIDKECPNWAQKGFCTDPTYTKGMMRLCCKSCASECKDKDVNCEEWAITGECKKNPDWMLKTCRKSCKVCAEPCIDFDANCVSWASKGECKNNPDWMLKYCRKSCNSCPAACEDNDINCAAWASTGECKKNPDYMLSTCRKSCNVCVGCVDNDLYCPDWAKTGECTKNKDYMLTACRKSCKAC